ncbi:MAG TPA: flagellar biosynthetic protein FliR [Phycisphaerae bacterium]|nr:flagellar biosynthetic protein FliR [Phycisphaerae bacterium]
MDELAVGTGWALTLLPTSARVAGMLLLAPVFGHAAVPVRLRIFIALVIGVAVAGGVAQPHAAPAGWAELALVIGVEVLIGAAIGYAVSLVFAGVQLGAAHVGAQMGISLGELYGASGDGSAGPVSSLFRLVALVTFLAIGGHRQLLAALLDTFDVVPVGGAVSAGGLLPAVVSLLGVSFVLALKVAAPVLVALLLAAVAMALLQRTLPQCHILSTGLPVRAMLGLGVMALSLAGVAWAVEAAWALTGQSITEMLKALG